MTYKGWEIMKMLAEGKIKEGDKYRVTDNDGFNIDEIYRFNGINFIDDDNEYVSGYLSDLCIATADFTLVEEIEKDIDIQAISKLDENDSETMNEQTISKKVNELIDAVKWLNKDWKGTWDYEKE